MTMIARKMFYAPSKQDVAPTNPGFLLVHERLEESCHEDSWAQVVTCALAAVSGIPSYDCMRFGSFGQGACRSSRTRNVNGSYVGGIGRAKGDRR